MNYLELATNLIRKEGERVMSTKSSKLLARDSRHQFNTGTPIEKSSTWQEIRSHWVNGEQEEARDLFMPDGYHMPNVLLIILEALDTHERTRTGTHTGDITDLREIIRSLL